MSTFKIACAGDVGPTLVDLVTNVGVVADVDMGIGLVSLVIIVGVVAVVDAM